MYSYGAKKGSLTCTVLEAIYSPKNRHLSKFVKEYTKVIFLTIFRKKIRNELNFLVILMNKVCSYKYLKL